MKIPFGEYTMPQHTNALGKQGNCTTTNTSVTSIAHDERINPELCSGFGAYHSNESSAKNPKPYVPINLDEIRQLVDKPQEVDKSEAQWLIPSTLMSRTFKTQEEQGEYWMLWADIDKDPKPIIELSKIIEILIPDADYEIYTSRSATETCQKSRGLIPLSKPLSGADWATCQEILNDKLQEKGITPDRANERAAQLCYLPNLGEYYDSKSKREGRFFDSMSEWLELVQVKQAKSKARTEELEGLSKQAKSKHAAFNSFSDTSSLPNLIGAFNEAYAVQDILLQADYDQKGNTFRHPNSESGSFSASVEDGRAHSLSSKDPLWSDGKGAHDAFSAFCVLFCDGDQNEALRQAGDQWLTIEGLSWNKVKRCEYMREQEDNIDSLPEINEADTGTDFDLDYPPGLVGKIADYIFTSSRNPIKSFAIAGALSTASHMNANYWYVSGSDTPLNLYQCLLGDTGKGKEDPRRAIKRLCDGGGIIESIASAPALLRALQTGREMIYLSDEMGMYLQVAMSERGSTHQKELIKDLMTFYGLGRSYFAGKVYADTKNNIDQINKPYVNVLGTTTSLELLEGITMKAVNNGFLNRFLFIPASEENPINRSPDTEIDFEIDFETSPFIDKDGLIYEAGAQERLIELVKSEKGKFADLWSRAEEQAIRVAGLLAMGDGRVIRCEHVEWAWCYVDWSIKSFSALLGNDLTESAFQKMVIKALAIIRDARQYKNDSQFREFCMKGYMPRGKLLKLLKIKSKELDEVVSHLEESKQIVSHRVDGSKAFSITQFSNSLR